MKILVVSSEVVPYAKTGGLADVAGALPKALASLKHDVRVAMPKYASIDDEKYNLKTEMSEIVVNFQGNIIKGAIKKGNFPNTNIPVYFVENEKFYNREELYGENGKDYEDNALRFAFFSMATIWMLKGIRWQPDIIMCNDWQAALIPIYLRNIENLKSDFFYKKIKVLYTTHNLAYQGIFPKEMLPKIGLDRSVFTMDKLEYYDNINLTKGAIIFSDAVSTVSKQYAAEIQTKEFGCGLEGVLVDKAKAIYGIINGIDYGVWNPAVDTLIPDQYTPEELEGKGKCKSYLQQTCGLPEDKDIPLIGIISRLVDQKGFDLIAEAMDELMKSNLQMILLGTGDPKYHKIFEDFNNKYPQKFKTYLKFDNKLAHEIEAGCDMFLMPSKFEPCGLNQLYSLKYGTIPIVRSVGGLADSIEDVTEESLDKSLATGFVFSYYNSKELMKTVKRALDIYNNKKEVWQKIMLTGMQKDFSWNQSAKEYIKIFSNIVGKKTV